MNKQLLIGLLFVCLVAVSKAQLNKADSLKNILSTHSLSKSDKCKVLLGLTSLYMDVAPTEAIKYGLEGIELVQKDSEIEAEYCLYLAGSYQNLSDYKEAIKYQQRGLAIANKIKNKGIKASFLVTEGNIQQYLLNFKTAIEKYKLARKEFKELLRVIDEIKTVNNIAIMFEYLSLPDSAEFYYAQLMDLVEKNLPEKDRNIFYMNYGDFIGRKNSNLGLYYLNKAIAISRKYNRLNELATMYLAFAEVNIDKKDFATALKYADSSLMVCIDRGLRRIAADVYEIKARIYANKGDFKKAYKFISINRDTLLEIVGEENAKQVNEYQAKYQAAEKEKKIALLHKENELKTNIIEGQKKITLIIVVALLLLGLLLIIIITSLKKIKKANQLLNLQQQKIVAQNKKLEEQNKEILDSINYAKRIQDAILGEVNHVSQELPPHFILFKPKDIVCGDFYWAHLKNDSWYVAVADCTGHGVPGAMMSMLGISALNEIIAQPDEPPPATILNLLRDKIVSEMGQTGKELENKDGMDISLLKLNLKTLLAEWAGAHNPLWIMNTTVTEIKADPQPIGYNYNMTPFTNHILQFNKGDCIYMFSDGFADQFGGPKGKKFKYKSLQNLLFDTKHLKPEEQKEAINRAFEEWKGDYDQLDDVCVMGIFL